MVFFQEIPLDVVDDVVGFQRVGLGGELDVERCELMPRAVVVDHQIMDAQHPRVLMTVCSMCSTSSGEGLSPSRG